MRMKRIIWLLVPVLMLSSCKPKSQQEKIEGMVKDAVMQYVSVKLPYPKGAKITEIQFDTLSSNYEIRHSLDIFKEPLPKMILMNFANDKIDRMISKADTMQSFDTTSPNKYYCIAKITVRHLCDEGKNYTMDEYIVPVWDGKIYKVYDSKELNDLSNIEEYIDCILPPEIGSVVMANMIVGKKLEEFNNALRKI